MQEQGKSRKPLIIGIVAAVAILAVVLVLLLTQCTGGGTGATTTPSTVETTEPVPTYELYWNADRAEYDGKSEAGMSSRMPESDGYFHVRFILDGEEVVLKVADRKLVNAIDIKDLMGLVFDEDGIVVGVVDIDDMPLEKLGWQFYVQSAAKTLIKLNSSESMNGMEVLLETDENTGIYDMSGKSGPVGVVADPINMDRVYAIANLAGEVTHVFIYQRPNYMLTHEAECQHCKKTVTWYEWVKTDEMPINGGHYQLQNDIQLKGQPAQAEDAKVCIDLNGKRVDGKSGSRCYAMFNAGTELAIMDTSEEQTGTLAAHGKGDQGMVVWVRYGAFYLYSGTLDASDATTKLNGTAVECGKGKFFYMYGGEIIGGTAEPQQNDKGNWTYGLGGTMAIGGKFVMNGGVIRDGYAKANVTWKNGTPSYARGMGGNIFASSGAVIEINDGEIRNGRAGNVGGNIYMDGTAELTINGGKITGGYINGQGRNGGNLFIGAKSVVTHNGGYVMNGQCRNCGGNIYLNGTYNMNGGVISGGRIRDFKTGAVVENAPSANVFVVNGQFFMRGGKVAGGFQLIDTDAKKTTTRLHLSGLSVIDGGENCTRNLTLSSGGSGIMVTVGTLHEKAKIGVYATTGYFTEPTKEANKDKFFSDIEGADILYHSERLALGRLQCICGKDEHFGACDGTEYVFAPWTSTTGLPNTQGKYYLLKDVKMTGTNNVYTNDDGKDVDIVLDLNGKNVTKASGSARVYSLFENKVAKNPDGTYAGNIVGEGCFVTLTDSVGTSVVDLNTVADGDQGLLVWGRYNDSKINIYGGTYNGTNVTSLRHNGVIISTSGELNIYGGTFDGGNSTGSGGIISVSGSKGVFNFYDGVIKNGTVTHSGGNVNVGSGATMNMYGGTITGGSINKDGTMVGDLGYGGNIVVGGTLNMYGGTISDGLVKIGLAGQKEDGTKISAGGGLSGNLQVNGTANLLGGVIKNGNATTGGNIGTNNANATIILDGVQVLDGVAGSGGNIAINVRANKLTEIKGETLISGGTATSTGGNLYVNAWVGNSKDVVINISGGTITDGTAGVNGGNIYLHNRTSGATAGKNVLTMSGGTISGGKLTDTTKSGGSIYLYDNSEFVLNDGTVTGGGNAKQGGNFYLTNNTSKLTVNGGEILNGDANDCGGNIQLQNRAVLVVNGGLIKGGTKNGVQVSNSNVYSVNGNVTVNGGEIVGGFNNTCTYEGGCILKLDKDAKVTTNEAGYGLTRNKWSSDATVAASMTLPVIEVGELSEKASIALGTAGYNTVPVDAKYLANFSSALNDAEVYHFEDRIFLGKVACICGGTSDIGPCAEGGHKKVAWLPLSSQSISADGNYYLTADVNVTSQITMGNNDTRPTNVSLNLNGHSMTAGFRILQLWNESVLNIADHKDGGALLTRGNTGDNFGVIQMLGKLATVNFYSGKIGMADGYVTHKSVALIEAAGTFNMYGGEIFGGVNPTATLVNVGGTFNMYAGTVKDGYNGTIDGTTANRGGNFRVGGTLNVYGGTITGGKAKYGGNIAATGKVNVYGGTISDGHGYTGEATNYPQGGNIYLTGASAKLDVNGKATISGGVLTGSNWMPGGSIYASSKAQIVIDGGAVVEGGDGQDGNNIYLASDGTTATLKNCTIKNTVDGTGNIMVKRGNVTIDGATIINTANGYNLRANETTKVANYTFNSGLITGGKPNVNLGGDDTFVMNGGTIENGIGTNGGNVTLSSSKFTLNGGTIVGGSANNGGNFALSGACEMTVNGGEIKNGAATAGSGGNIIIWDASVVTLNDGTISGGTSTGNGGSIYIGGPSALNVNGGTVTGGESGDSAGNIAVYGKLVMTGGEVLNGKCKNTGNGMNISVINTDNDVTKQLHTLEISGGKIGGGLHFNNYKGNVIVSISGNPVIDKALSTEVTPTYSMALGKNDLTIGQLTDGAKIVVSGQEGVFSYKAPEGSAKFFESEVEGLAVFQTPADELVLVYGKQGCICGSTDGTHIGECDGTSHDWIPVTAMPETSGYYYLISDVTDSGDQRILKTAQNIYLDLNGHTVTSNKWRMYRFDVAGCSLTITDNSKDHNGKILVPTNRDQGSVVWFFSGASTFAMYNGTIDVSAANNGSASAGLAIAGGGGSVVKLFRGTIKGGTYAANNWGGSAVAMEGGATHFLGNVEITGTGSALFIADGCKVDMTHVTKAPETPWAIDASGIFTKGWNKDWKIEDYFTSASAYGCQIYLDEATGELKMGTMDCVCRQATCVGDCDGKDIFWQPLRSNGTLPTANGNYFLTRDVTGVGQKNITGDTKAIVRIDLNGKSVTANVGSRLYLLQKSNELHITDSVGTGVINGGGHSSNGGIFLPQNTSVLKIYAGNYTLRPDATATPTGGWIDASTSGVSIFGGNFTSSVNGGSLIVIRDNLTMNITGGTFTNTTSSEKAQTTFNLWTGSTLNISGGTINTTGENQRNIATDGTVNMSGGTIKGGNLTVNDNGASVKVSDKGTFKLSGGTVSGGNSANQGGNFAVYGKLYISGGTVKDGVSKADAGHNIAVISPNADTKAVLEISGGQIAGGVYFNCYYTTPTVKLSGKPTIDKALTSADAGAKPTYGIYVPASFDLDLTGLTGGEIHVKGAEAGQFATNATEAMVDYFVSETVIDGTTLPVCYDNGTLCFGQVYCLCGYTKSGSTLTAHESWCDQANLIWLPWSSASALPTTAGNYYLANSLTDVPETAFNNETATTVRLDLNGKTVTAKSDDRAYYVTGSNQLIITDTVGTGVVYGGGTDNGASDAYGGVIRTGGSSKLTICGGTYTLADNATVPGRGSIITVDSTFTLKGGKILVNKNTSAGVLVMDGKKMYMDGGQILSTAGHETSKIVTISLWTSSELHISGGTIETTAKNCRNIFSDGKIYMTGGEIKGGNISVNDNGGSIYVSNKKNSAGDLVSLLDISGGTISGGYSANQGGNIAGYGNVIISGTAVIKDGKSAGADNYNITMIGGSATLDVRGGTIAGGVLINNAGNGKPTVKLSGSPTIDKTMTSTGVDVPSCGINLGGSSELIDVTGLTGGRIGVKATVAGQFATNATSGMENYFVSETVISDVTTPITYNDGGLYFGQFYCLCGYTKTGTTLSKHTDWCTKTNYLWTPWVGSNTNTSGHYYLPKSMSQGQVEIGNSSKTDVVIDLNGFEIKASGSRVFRVMNGSLGMTDTSNAKSGKVIGKGINTQGGALLLSGGVTVNLYAGTWTLESGKSAGTYGGIMDIGTSTTVNMYSGTITGGTATLGGGNVSVRGGTFNMYGGTLTGGTAGEGGNIYVSDASSVVLVTGANTRIENGTANNSSWAPGGNIRITGNGTVTIEKGATVVGGKGSDGHNLYLSGASGKLNLGVCTIKNTSANSTNIMIELGTLTIDGASIENEGANACNVSANTSPKDSAIEDSCSATIIMNSGSITGGTNRNVNVPKKDSFTLNGGTISGGTVTGDGGNVYVGTNSSFTMTGGKISNGTATNYGGNIYSDATVKVTGGTISNEVATASDVNTKAVNAVCGGNIYMKGGELTVSGGTLSGGFTGSGGGGNIYATGCTIEFSGSAVIENGTSKHNGGNFRVAKSNVTVSGSGVIFRNGWSTNVSGNIHLEDGSSMTMTGGHVTGGMTGSSRGTNGSNANLFIVGTSFTMTGGTIDGRVEVYSGNANGKVILGGNAVIKRTGDTAPSLAITNPCISIYATKPLTTGAEIYITKSADGIISSVAVDQSYAKYFHADNTEKGIFWIDDSADADYGKLYFGYYNCICGGTATQGACADGGHAKVRWTAWNGTRDAMAPDGNYYLTTDATVSSSAQITIGNTGRPSNVSVNLNGHTLTTSFRVFQLHNAAVLSIADHKGGGAILTKGNTGDNFGGIQMLGSSATVNMYSGKIGFTETHVAHKDIALVEASGTFNMYGGSIEGSTSTTGTLVRVNGTFNMYGGEVKNGISATTAGNFLVGGRLNVYGGTISGGHAINQGGNVYVSGNGTFTLDGGTVKDGKSADCAGNVYANGLLVVKNGTITGGKKAASATAEGTYENNSNINLVNGDLTMTGGTIDGLNACNTTANGCIINISGKAKITNANGYGLRLVSLAESGATPPAAPVVNLGTLDASASICVDGQLNRVFATGTGAIFDNKGYFSSSDGYTVICTEDGLMMIDATKTHAHCVCGGELADDASHACVDRIYEALTTSTTEFSAKTGDTTEFVGYYYVPETDGNFSMSGTMYVRHNSSLYLCLNGQRLTSTTRTISMYCDGTATTASCHNVDNPNNAKLGTPKVIIADCGTGGILASDRTTADTGNALWVRYGEATLYGVTLDASKVTTADNTGHALAVVNGTATLYDVTLKGGVKGTDDASGKGATLALSGASSKVVVNGTLTIDNGEALDVYVGNDGIIDVTNMDNQNATLRISASGIFTTGNGGKANNDRFVPAIEGEIFVSEITRKGELFLGRTYCVCGVASNNPDDHKADCGNTLLEWRPWRSSTVVPSSTGNWYLTAKQTTTNQRSLAANQTIYLDLNGCTVTATGRVYYFSNSGTKVAITDSKNGGSMKGTNNTQGSTLWAPTDNSTLEIWGGTIYASEQANVTNGEGGSAILVKGSGSSLVINGGTITGGTVDGTDQNAKWGGGAVSVRGGTFTMNGGTITGGKANLGGSVYVSGAEFTMNGGVIEKGTTTNDNGGCLYVNKCTFTMNGGEIRNGVADNCGGNVYIGTGTFIMNGGTITGGTAKGSKTENSANLFAVNGSFTMTGGQIDGYATAISYNGGQCTVTLSGDSKITNSDNTNGLYLENGGENYVKGSIELKGLGDKAYITVLTKDNYASGDVIVTNVLNTDTDNLNITKGYLYDSETKQITLK